VLPNPIHRLAGPAALVAAMSILTVTNSAAGDANQPAPPPAPVRLEAEYVATIAGFTIGRGNWVIDISPDQYSATASGRTVGILRFFTGGHGTSASRGVFNNGRPVATSYAASYDFGRGVDDVRMTLTDGNVKELSVDPPTTPLPDRIPVADADRRGVVDPMTATLNRVGGNGDPVSPETCNRKTAVFDGRLRYDLESQFKRMEVVKEKGYAGPVVVCALYFKPISGYVPDRATIKYLVGLRDAEVWQAPIAGTRVLVPYRLIVPTPIGLGVLAATQFVSIVQPVRTGAIPKTE
jgi:hypothetical protein